MLKASTRKLIKQNKVTYRSARHYVQGTRDLAAKHLKESKAKLGSKELRRRLLSSK